MSKYTTQLRYPIEQKLKDLKLDPGDQSNWPRCYEMLGLHDYPIFDELYRRTLNDKIILSYYFREIGQETVGQFAWQMRKTMHQIMPYYNQLYASQGLVTDPMLGISMDYSEKWTRDEETNRKGASESSSANSSTSKDRNVFQDTPMNGLDTGAIESMDYATTVTFDDTSSNSNGTTSGKSENDYTGDFEGTKVHNQKGFDKSQSELLLTYRKTFLNIDLEIIRELNDMFLLVW